LEAAKGLQWWNAKKTVMTREQEKTLVAVIYQET